MSLRKVKPLFVVVLHFCDLSQLHSRSHSFCILVSNDDLGVREAPLGKGQAFCYPYVYNLPIVNGTKRRSNILRIR